LYNAEDVRQSLEGYGLAGPEAIEWREESQRGFWEERHEGGPLPKGLGRVNDSDEAFKEMVKERLPWETSYDW